MIEQVSLDLLHVAMNIASVQHKTAAANVASYHVKGAATLQADFAPLLQQLASSDQYRAELAYDTLANWQQVESASVTATQIPKPSLDQLSAELVLSSGKYKLLAETASRQLGLMQLAINGGKR